MARSHLAGTSASPRRFRVVFSLCFFPSLRAASGWSRGDRRTAPPSPKLFVRRTPAMGQARQVRGWAGARQRLAARVIGAQGRS